MRRTYNEIREMIRGEVMDIRMARAIVRKSGIRPGKGSHIPVPVLNVAPASNITYGIIEWSPTTAGGYSDGFVFHPFGSAPKAAAKVDLTNASEVRVVLTNRRAGRTHNYLYPMYHTAQDWMMVEDELPGSWRLFDDQPVPQMEPGFDQFMVPQGAGECPFFDTGGSFGEWVPVPENARGEVFVAFGMTIHIGTVVSISMAQIQAR